MGCGRGKIAEVGGIGGQVCYGVTTLQQSDLLKTRYMFAQTISNLGTLNAGDFCRASAVPALA